MLMFKDTVKMDVSALKKQQKQKEYHFDGLLFGPSRVYYLGQVWHNKK